MPQLPTGTVTFLFTDVVESTRLFEQHQALMQGCLARHDELNEAAVGLHEGVIVRPRGEGDSRFAVFARATDAVSAAAAVQRALLGEPWPAPVTIRVRLALHTGEAEVREGDYYGSAVNRCARIRSIGHGGQVLFSQATYELARDHMPSGVEARNLGRHRLKDLERAEEIYQLLAPDLPADFPSLRSLNTLPNNLPLQVTSFIGRQKEMAEARRLLGENRLLTLTGAGGTGKTRLGLQVAADMLDQFADGAWVAELAPLTDASLVPQAVAAAMGLREESGRPLMTTLLQHLQPRHLLLVLDNCEHLMDGCRMLADELLRRCPEVRLIATSREALGIAGEVAIKVPSLARPEPGHLPPLESLRQFEAVRLFIARAVAASPSFAIDNENAPAVAQICWQLDGIPLAIELAAARVKAMSVQQICNRLGDCFRLLTGGNYGALPRHQTLRALIGWSYDLLSDNERALWQRFTTFAGGWTLEAAEAVCAGSGARAELASGDILDLLMRLVEKSLVLFGEPGERYRMLETIKLYGQQSMPDSDPDLFAQRHRDWFVALAELAQPHLTGADSASWFDRLELEHDNLRVAVEWSLTRGDLEPALRLVGAVWRFWETRGYFSAARQRCERLLASVAASTAPVSPVLRLKALHAAAVFASRQADYAATEKFFRQGLQLARDVGDKNHAAASISGLSCLARREGRYPEALSLCEEALAIYRELDDQRGIAKALNHLSVIMMHQGRYDACRGYLEQSLAIRRRLGDEQIIGVSLTTLGTWAADTGDVETARIRFSEARELFRKIGDRRGLAITLGNLALMERRRGDWNAVGKLAEEGQALERELGDKRGLSISDNLLGHLALAQGDLPRAELLMKRSLTTAHELNDRRWLIFFLESLATLAGSQGHGERAACLFGAAEALREAVGCMDAPGDRDLRAQAVSQARSAADSDGDFASAWDRGRQLTQGKAVAFALEEG